MNFVDILLLLPLVYGLVRGLLKGLVHELASVLAIIFGIYFAYTYSAKMSTWLAKHFEASETTLEIAGYISVFLVVSLGLYALAFILTKMLKFMMLGMVNRVLGGVFGFLKSLLLLCLFIFFAQPWFNQWKKNSPQLKKSIVYEYLLEASLYIGGFSTDFNRKESPFDFIPPSIKDSLDARELFSL